MALDREQAYRRHDPFLTPADHTYIATFGDFTLYYNRRAADEKDKDVHYFDPWVEDICSGSDVCNCLTCFGAEETPFFLGQGQLRMVGLHGKELVGLFRVCCSLFRRGLNEPILIEDETSKIMGTVLTSDIMFTFPRTRICLFLHNPALKPFLEWLYDLIPGQHYADLELPFV